jgi:ATP-dependent RNA helicase DDX10/DBP4
MTTASLVQLVEALYRERWTNLDGLGALVLSPTRELALQIFEDLRKVGKHHALSAGLLIGGKDVGAEQAHILRAQPPAWRALQAVAAPAACVRR